MTLAEMTILDRRIDEVLAQGRAIQAMSCNIYWFLVIAAHRAISADTRELANKILNSYETPAEMCFSGWDLAYKCFVESEPNYVGERAKEVLYQVHEETCKV